MRKSKNASIFKSMLAAACSLAMCATLAACGNTSNSNDSKDSSSNSSKSGDTSLDQIAGVTAKGELGKKPEIALAKTPMTVQNNTYAVLQKGNGDVIEDGDRVCAQGIAVNVKDGSELMSTWEKNTPDCSLVVSKSSMNESYYNLLKGQKLNATVAVGVNDSNSSGTSYIMAMTLVSKSKDLKRAEGEKVKDIPADLPKVTLDKDGKPSIDMNGQGDVDKLIVQPLIKGKGKKVKETDTVSANYTGWLTNGKQFDSSWDRGQPADFSLQRVVKGWTQGLAGQTVGSQVLLVIPPDLGYGKDGSGDSIPGNATLVFVVDILAAY